MIRWKWRPHRGTPQLPLNPLLDEATNCHFDTASIYPQSCPWKSCKRCFSQKGKLLRLSWVRCRSSVASGLHWRWKRGVQRWEASKAERQLASRGKGGGELEGQACASRPTTTPAQSYHDCKNSLKKNKQTKSTKRQRSDRETYARKGGSVVAGRPYKYRYKYRYKYIYK